MSVYCINPYINAKNWASITPSVVYEMDDLTGTTLTDTSGNSINALATNSSMLNQSGIIGKCVAGLSGNSVYCGNNSKLSFTDGTDDRAGYINIWVKFTSFPASQVLVQKVDVGLVSPNFQYEYALSLDSKSLKFVLSNGVTYTSATNYLQASITLSSAGIVANTWYMLTFEYDPGKSTKTDRLSIYKNASKLSTSNVEIGTFDKCRNTNTNLVIGNYQTNSTVNYVRGYIDQTLIVMNKVDIGVLSYIYNNGYGRQFK